MINKLKLTAGIEERLNPSITSSLFKAIDENNSEELESVLTSHPSHVNARDQSGTPLLHAATARGNYGLVALILAQQHVDLTARDRFQRDALEFAIVVGHPRIKDAIFRRRAEQLGLASDAHGLQSNGPI